MGLGCIQRYLSFTKLNARFAESTEQAGGKASGWQYTKYTDDIVGNSQE
jgi:hypothetical protein